MSIKINAFKVNMDLIEKKECVVCQETVKKKTEEGVLEFFGHIDEIAESKELKAHLICGSCSPRVVAEAKSNNVFRNCISCNSTPGDDWRKKFTWDIEAQEFTVESAPLDPFQDVPEPVIRINRLNTQRDQSVQLEELNANLSRLIKWGGVAIGGITITTIGLVVASKTN